MKVEDIIEIHAIRQQFMFGAQLKVASPLLSADICARFCLVDSGLSHFGLAHDYLSLTCNRVRFACHWASGVLGVYAYTFRSSR